MSLKPGWQGRFFEDLEIGDYYRHPLGRTISEADNTWFTLLTMNTNQVHFNREYAAQSEFGRRLVVSTLTLAIAVGQSVTDVTQNAIANLGFEAVRLTRPVYVGDTIWSESVVEARRESNSRPHAGIVTVSTRTLNQDGAEVLSFRRTFLVMRRSAQSSTDVFPVAQEPFDADGQR